MHRQEETRAFRYRISEFYISQKKQTHTKWRPFLNPLSFWMLNNEKEEEKIHNVKWRVASQINKWIHTILIGIRFWLHCGGICLLFFDRSKSIVMKLRWTSHFIFRIFISSDFVLVGWLVGWCDRSLFWRWSLKIIVIIIGGHLMWCVMSVHRLNQSSVTN